MAAVAGRSSPLIRICPNTLSSLELPLSLRSLNHFYVKRDDLLELRLGTSGDTTLSGNKARKFCSLVRGVQALPAADLKRTEVVSIGGNNSNAMLALSKICFSFQINFTYYTRNIPSNLQEQRLMAPASAVTSNLVAAANTYKASIVSLGPSEYARTFVQLEAEAAERSEGSEAGLYSGRLVIPRGGSDESAREGLGELALELLEDIALLQRREPAVTRWTVALASGTGATAYYCHTEMARIARIRPDLADTNVRVLALPCVGSSAYLLEQMDRLRQADKHHASPTLPSVATEGDALKRPFARPCSEHLRLYRQLRILGAGFDLVYAPRAMEVLAAHAESLGSQGQEGLVLYCCGGAEGDAAQMARYRREGLGCKLFMLYFINLDLNFLYFIFLYLSFDLSLLPYSHTPLR